MSRKYKGQAVAPTEPLEPITRSMIQGFIEIAPNFFKTLLADQKEMHKVDFLSLRDPANNYKNGLDDVYGPADEDEEMEAGVYFHEASMEKFVYVPRKGYLYCLDDIMQISELIAALRAHEALKVID